MTQSPKLLIMHASQTLYIPGRLQILTDQKRKYKKRKTKKKKEKRRKRKPGIVMPTSPVQRLPDTQLPPSASRSIHNPVSSRKPTLCFSSLSIIICLAATSSSPSYRMKAFVCVCVSRIVVVKKKDFKLKVAEGGHSRHKLTMQMI
ncbi:hypothetical protein B0I37DRAFT_24706 [Chaetomium sp. MPI-CAGE-AT-0009]|nr:hypothetical protein B0I37DRAFT_24706 [Chaetomium sp. MPI-CAGE-AT-0009]